MFGQFIAVLFLARDLAHREHFKVTGPVAMSSTGLDQSLNCAIKLSDGWGAPDEMLSARARRLREQHPTLRKVIDGLFFWDKNHCQECYEIE